MKKGALEISFAWLFAIIIGAIILFFAIYVTVKSINNQETLSDAKVGKEIGILLSPLETGFEEGRSSSLSMPVKTRIYNRCDQEGTFGRQAIKVSQMSFNKWTETNLNIYFENKYIFSEEYVEGEKFFVFSKPFNFPFKVVDLIYLTSEEDKYCFIDVPPRIQEEIEDLEQDNLILEENCEGNEIKVCFDQYDCNISVDTSEQAVRKNNQIIYYEGDALMYGAIFSDKEVYECQIKRIMKKAEQLSILYVNKEQLIMQTVGCSSDANLAALINFINSYSYPQDLRYSQEFIDSIDTQNELNPDCLLW